MPLANVQKGAGHHHEEADAEEAVEEVGDEQWTEEEEEEGVTGRGGGQLVDAVEGDAVHVAEGEGNRPDDEDRLEEEAVEATVGGEDVRRDGGVHFCKQKCVCVCVFE